MCVDLRRTGNTSSKLVGSVRGVKGTGRCLRQAIRYRSRRDRRICRREHRSLTDRLEPPGNLGPEWMLGPFLCLTAGSLDVLRSGGLCRCAGHHCVIKVSGRCSCRGGDLRHSPGSGRSPECVCAPFGLRDPGDLPCGLEHYIFLSSTYARV